MYKKYFQQMSVDTESLYNDTAKNILSIKHVPEQIGRKIPKNEEEKGKTMSIQGYQTVKYIVYSKPENKSLGDMEVAHKHQQLII